MLRGISDLRRFGQPDARTGSPFVIEIKKLSRGIRDRELGEVTPRFRFSGANREDGGAIFQFTLPMDKAVTR